MAETDIAMPESTSVDSRPAFAIVEELKTKFGENFYVQTTFEDFPTVWVERARVQDVLMFLRTVSRPYVMLFDLSAVDERLRTHRDGLPASDFTVFYHLLSLERNTDIRIKVALSESDLNIPTATNIWPNANWYEREAYDMFAGNGILFNHESPLRGETFVTRKITRAVAQIALGQQDKLYLGNLDAQRDWGHAKDYVEAMWLILQQDTPEDYVIATGITTRVREFVRMAFAYVGIEVEFTGEGVDEKGIVKSCSNPAYQVAIGTEVVAVDPRYFRPTEVELLIGDPTKAQTKLNWKPKFDLNALVDDMMQADVALFSK